MGKLFVVVSYDVSDDRKRRKLAKFLLDYGKRVQKSVFEVVASRKSVEKMKRRARKFIDEETDSIRYYTLCGRCVVAVEHYGAGPPPEEEEDLIVV
ncbi:MAG: CRISPR-associated endonuclease Cas2 [Deltaproteobacteria bacterium]|nr:MAG: CRISPR-associated endonuclease Cas2 [Deltaproteobacteria bacterium]